MFALTLAEHVSIAPSSIAYVAAAVAGAVGAIHGIVRIIDRTRNGKQVPTIYNCGLEPSIRDLKDAINKLCAVTIERSKLEDQRFDVLDKAVERVEHELRSQT